MSGNSASASSGESPFVIIQRGTGKILLRAGHQFYKKKQYNTGLSIWECSQRRKMCKGRIKIKDGNIVEETAHTCTPNFGKNEIDENLYKCKQDLTSQNYLAVPQTYNTMVASYENRGLQLIAEMPNFKSVKSSLYRYRNKVAGVDKIQCDKIEDVQIVKV